MELGEDIAEGASRETLEEACAEVRIGRLFVSVDVIYAGQLHLFFTAKLLGDYAPGDESLEVQLFEVPDIPWDEMAFSSNSYALKKFIEDGGEDKGLHRHVIRDKRSANPNSGGLAGR